MRKEFRKKVIKIMKKVKVLSNNSIFRDEHQKKKVKPIKIPDPINFQQMSILIGLTNYDVNNRKGWMFLGEIIAEKRKNGTQLISSRRTSNFDNWIKPLIKKYIIKEKYWYKDKDGWHAKNQYKLKREDNTKIKVYSLIINNMNSDDPLPILFPEILQRPYFDKLDETYSRILDKSIRNQRIKLANLWNVKLSRNLKQKEASSKKQ